jgi:phage terminase large subunit GpA-like protein
VKGGVKVFPLGVSHLKRELYSWLALPDKEGPKVCHFPMYGRDYFKQLCAEEYRAEKLRGHTVWKWHQTGPNEALDCRILARAAAIKLGIDHWRSRWLDFEIEAGHKEPGAGASSQSGTDHPGLVNSQPAPEEHGKAGKMQRHQPQPVTKEPIVRPLPTPPPRKKYVFRPPRPIPRRGW